MLKNRLINSFVNMDYKRLNVNTDNILIFYRFANSRFHVVIFIYAISGEEYTLEQYRHIVTQIRNEFIRRGEIYPEVLSMIITREPDKMKQLSREEDNLWLIDLTTYRLMLFENQTIENRLLSKEIESLLLEEQLEDDLAGYPEDSGYDYYEGRRKRPALLSLLNSILIITNIAVFLAMNHTMLFGETRQAMTEGALSWYFVFREGEYYRLLTSMFIHSGSSHLMNNMLVLFFVGDNLERASGKIRYLFIYFGSGIVAGLLSISYNMMKNNYVYSVGASGAIFGVVGAMLYILILNKGRLEDISSRQIILFALFSLYGGIINVRIDNVAHIGGFLAGLALAAIFYRRPKKVLPQEMQI